MAGRLHGKVALVTGAGSGIGRATAIAFAREQARLVLADIAEKGGQETLDAVKAAGAEAIFIKADVSRDADVEALVQKAVTTFGRLDCAHNNAGIEGELTTLADCSRENWDRTLAVNLTGVWMCMKAEIRQMLKQGGGAIVNTASVAGLVGFPTLPAYCASKFGVVGITKVAALEYARANIRVNAVCPGVIRTPMVERAIQANRGLDEAFIAIEPVGRFGEPEEIAETVVWLCSDAASFVTGVAMPVDGGLTAQ